MSNMTSLSENNQTEDDANENVSNDPTRFSCKECKRRRIKCSREIPVCNLCSKYKRHCLYEKHSRTPLTRKHLTEVEEELRLVKQILDRYVSEVDVSNLLQKVKNGTDISDIPELNVYFDERGYKRRKVDDGLKFPSGDRTVANPEKCVEDGNNELTKKRSSNVPNNSTEVSKNPDETNTDSSTTSDCTNNTSKEGSAPSNGNIINIQSLLVNGVENDKNNGHGRGHINLQKEFNESGDFQIPQLLPISISLDPTKRTTSMIGTKKKNISKQIELSPSSNNSTYNWDERNQHDGDTQPSIIDGIATTESSGYLGASSSAAFINLMGGGFFLHSKSKSHTRGNEIGNSPALSTDSSSLQRASVSKQKLEHHINQYFETYHISYPIIHKPMFMAQFNEIISPPSVGWESLVHMVAAIGSFMSAASPDENDDLFLFDIAKSKLSIEVLETGNLTLVQTFTLMSNYLQKRDRPNSGYNYLGLAVRMALGLGMHKHIENTEDSLFNQEIRKRIWWCLYIFDCGQTITYGRPLGIPCAGIDAELPLNISDSNLTGFSSSIPKESNEPTIYTSVRLQSSFHLLTNSIYERIITDPFPSASLMLKWDGRYIERWLSSIPDYFKKDAEIPLQYKLAHSVLEWRYRNLRIIMYRTFLLKRVVMNSKSQGVDDQNEINASEICLHECDATINSMERYWNQKPKYNRMDAWYSLCFLIPAVLMPLVCLRNDPLSIRAEFWRSQIIVARNIIKRLMYICPTASRILDLIDQLGAGYIRSQSEDENNGFSYATSGTDESPLSQLMQLHWMLWPVSFDIEQQFNL